MGCLSSRAARLAPLLCLAACSSVGVEPNPKPVAVLQYQHVANAHEIRFTNPIGLSAALYPVNYVVPVNAKGFWAIFVLCSADVSAQVSRGFHYNVNNFRVRHGGKLHGAIKPYTMRYQGTADLNTPADTAPILDAIAAELYEGPPHQMFAPGFYPDLNYRFAVYLPRGLEQYAGGPLQLQYLGGQPVVMVSNRYPPSDLEAVGGTGAGVTATCLP